MHHALKAALLAGASSLLLLSACSKPDADGPIADAAARAETTSLHSQQAANLGIPVGTPESKGFSTAGLDALNAAFHGLVDQKKLAGVTTLIARHGDVVHFDVYGKSDVTTGAALAPDGIFRIASMTKPIAGVAMMQLYEQGKWKLEDPVSNYIPEFANLKVKKAGGGTEAMTSQMTMAQLMSHTAGFGVSAVYADAKLNETNLQGMIDKLAKLPLETQPGTAWDYGPSVDIQGYIVEKLSGQSLDAYLQEHITGPLGMVDTGFWVAPEKASRVVTIHTYDEAGAIKTDAASPIRTEKPSFLSGSGGLYSTAADYFRFAQAMLNKGELNGTRILKPETVELMRTSVLPASAKVDLYGPSQEGIGFGMDFAIVQDPQLANTQQGKDSFYWGGAYGTWFWIDPTNDLVFVGMIQNRNGSRPDAGTPPTRAMSYKLVYDALSDPAK
jgi:CubicO group peptidase (beta-lactamase class C family)